jgi:hypothetical protein
MKNLSLQSTLAHCVLQAMRYSRVWGKKHAHLKRKAEFELWKELAKAQLDLQEARQDPLLRAKVDYCRQKLEELDEERAEWISSTI